MHKYRGHVKHRLSSLKLVHDSRLMFEGDVATRFLQVGKDVPWVIACLKFVVCENLNTWKALLKKSHNT